MSQRDVVIEVHDLAKCYRLGVVGARTFRDELENLFNRKAREARAVTDFWALDGVSFEVRRGELVGVIGTNGAGKSTLLKIISRITGPTRGHINLHGRTSSLLEVGTGFHPELTGRENIFLNGAILGMKRKEIASKYDEIVEFAGLQKFIETPVKRYSSGMYVRLAFAVAAHLEPEILIVDEVLAVGDAQFQQKCINKLRNVANSGRTILFVSHNGAAIETLCDRVIWLAKGKVVEDGPTGEVMSKYLHQFADEDRTVKAASADGSVCVTNFRLLNGEGQETQAFEPGESMTVEIELYSNRPVHNPRLGLFVVSNGVAVFGANQALDGTNARVLNGKSVVSCRFPKLPLMAKQDFQVGATLREGDPPAAIISGLRTSFTMMGSAESMGWEGEHAHRYVAGAPPVLIPHQWIVDGEVRQVACSESFMGPEIEPALYT
jgi:lipopolysaccharide transport system ATP-binding protein